MGRTQKPDWWDAAKFYYSEIDLSPGPPARVFIPPAEGNVTPERPGALCLSLEPRRSELQVMDAQRRERGIIRSEGFIPAAKYVMRRDGAPVWILSVRSIVRKRHALDLGGERWTFDTPFYWWQHFSGGTCGVPRVFGGYPDPPTKRIWVIAIEPGRDTPDLLTAIAFMHRNWLFWWHGP